MDPLMSSFEQVRQAWRLALSGDVEGARRLLEAANPGSLSVEGADLLARLAVREGHFAEARQLWNAILRVAPAYEPAARALECLNSSWLFHAVGKKLLKLFALMVAVLLAGIGGWALLMGIPNSYAAVTLTMGLAISVAVFVAGVGVWMLFMGTSRLRTSASVRQGASPAGPGVASAISTPEYAGIGPDRELDRISSPQEAPDISPARAPSTFSDVGMTDVEGSARLETAS